MRIFFVVVIYYLTTLDTTTEKDFLKQIDRFPLPNLRNKYEDLLEHNDKNSFIETSVVDDP